GQEILTFQAEGCTWSSKTVFSPDWKHLAGFLASKVWIWDATTGKVKFTLTGHTASVRRIAFSLDGKRLASGDEEGTVKVWDVTTGQETITVKPKVCVDRLAFSPDGRRLVSGGMDGSSLRIWGAGPAQTFEEMSAQQRPQHARAFFADAKAFEGQR